MAGGGTPQGRQGSDRYNEMCELEKKLRLIDEHLLAAKPDFSIEALCERVMVRVLYEIDHYVDAFVPFVTNLPSHEEIPALLKHLKAMMVLPAVLVESRIASYFTIRNHFGATSTG